MCFTFLLVVSDADVASTCWFSRSLAALFGVHLSHRACNFARMGAPWRVPPHLLDRLRASTVFHRSLIRARPRTRIRSSCHPRPRRRPRNKRQARSACGQGRQAWTQARPLRTLLRTCASWYTVLVYCIYCSCGVNDGMYCTVHWGGNCTLSRTMWLSYYEYVFSINWRECAAGHFFTFRAHLLFRLH